MKGIGTDIIEIDRLEKILSKYGNKFLSKFFSQEEIDYCKRSRNIGERLAGRYAAKEAVAKALGSGFSSKLGWQDLKILNTPEGQPYVVFSDVANANFNYPKVLVSISHCKAYATAVALWQ